MTTPKQAVALTGTVKFYDPSKGFGFIRTPGGPDHYFNSDCIKNAVPIQGDSVAFVSVHRSKGPQATDILVLQSADELARTNATESTDPWTKDQAPVKRRGGGRVECGGCKASVIPRLVTRDGRPRRSFCPMCAHQIQDFGISNIRLFRYVFQIIVFSAIAAGYFGWYKP